MIDWLKKRFQEPSTYMGLSLVISGAGVLGRIDEADAVAGALAQAGNDLAAGNWQIALPLLIGGIFGAFMGEKGGKNE